MTTFISTKVKTSDYTHLIFSLYIQISGEKNIKPQCEPSANILFDCEILILLVLDNPQIHCFPALGLLLHECVCVYLGQAFSVYGCEDQPMY